MQMLRLTRRVDGFERVLDQPLRAAHRARHVEAAIEIAKILRRLERFFERRLREAKGGPESLEFARIYLAHPRIIAPERAYSRGS